MKMMRRREQGDGPACPAWLGRGGGVRKGVGRGVWRRERGKMNSKRVLLNPPNPTFNKEVSQTPFSFLASAPLVCSRQESRDHPRKNHRQASKASKKARKRNKGFGDTQNARKTHEKDVPQEFVDAGINTTESWGGYSKKQRDRERERNKC